MTTNKDTAVEVRCLVFRSPDGGSGWCAVALEMDIWGFGNSKEEARGDLEELIETQVEFATGRKELDILDHPAEGKWFKLWDELEKLGKETVISKSFAQIDAPINIPRMHNIEYRT